MFFLFIGDIIFLDFELQFRVVWNLRDGGVFFQGVKVYYGSDVLGIVDILNVVFILFMGYGFSSIFVEGVLGFGLQDFQS